MNVIRIAGGLGNQIFQYAFGKSMMQNGIDVKFNMRWSATPKNAHRPFRLDKFRVNIPICHITNKVIHEKNISGCDLSLLKRDGFTFAGYWQYMLYFIDLIPVLKKEICVREEFYNEEFLVLREKILNTESVGIHIRRGDYVYQKGFYDLPFKYYLNAINYTDGELFIFSDDIPWCKEKFKESYFSRKITFVSLIDYLDFELLKLCKHQVTANSTFSYWAALLNDYTNKVVVSPNVWLGDNIIDDERRFPKEWIKIEGNVVQDV
jgi:hypothetical protein